MTTYRSSRGKSRRKRAPGIHRIKPGQSTILLERAYRFSASHLYRRPDWSEAENRRAFGKCANLPGHGHNYRLAVAVTGTVDRTTGFLVDLAALDELIERRVIAVLDHQHVNAALPEFGPGGEIPSGENLVRWITGRINGELPAGVSLRRVRLEEDESLAAELELT